MTEKNYGRIPDRVAWDLPLTTMTSLKDPFQVFSGADVDPTTKAVALARTENLGVYLRRFREGGGENGLHSHDTDGIWLVLEGAVTFHGEDDRLIAELAPDEGVLVPRDVSYRFLCTKDSVLLRFGGEPPAKRTADSVS
ncbi:hypothetical protein ACSMXN_21580 [Jatrophihabitans sp. DSM 45814]